MMQWQVLGGKLEQRADMLVKPDMSAVLARTHLNIDLHGLLLPIFEDISNAIHAVKMRFEESSISDGQISVRFVSFNDPNRYRVIIQDNGIGLDDTNYKSFRTPFSGLKLRERGRGFGRFISFKVFAKAEYKSRYSFFKDVKTRCFRFDIHEEKEIIFLAETPTFDHSGVCVTLSQPLTSWHEVIASARPDTIADEIGRHFLPYFLQNGIPSILLQFDDEKPEELSSRFREAFIQYADGSIECSIDGKSETVNYSLARVSRTKQFRNHSLLFSAANRIVGAARDLTNKIGKTHFQDKLNRPYVVIAVVRSEAFESRLNDSRTGINLGLKDIEELVSKISDLIEVAEDDQMKIIKDSQSNSVGDALRENPILRLGLRGRTISDYVRTKPNNWTSENFVSDLAIERYRETNDLSKQITAAANNREDYSANIKRIVDRLDENKKEALAEYVIHRKSIIELVESARRFQPNGSHSPEDVIHDLIFKRFSDNAAQSYFEHNLWLVDDALAFLPYVSSDRTLHGGRRKTGDKVSDLLFFNDSMVLGDNDGTTLTIIEFKKPNRDNYQFGGSKSDPVSQVIETLEQAVDAGGITKTDGAFFSFAGVVRKSTFIVADLTPTLVKVLKKHDFRNDWNPHIHVRYRENEQMLIQAFGYNTLIENAKK